MLVWHFAALPFSAGSTAIFNRSNGAGNIFNKLSSSRLSNAEQRVVGRKYNQHIESWIKSFRSENDFFEYLIKVRWRSTLVLKNWPTYQKVSCNRYSRINSLQEFWTTTNKMQNPGTRYILQIKSFTDNYVLDHMTQRDEFSENGPKDSGLINGREDIL